MEIGVLGLLGPDVLSRATDPDYDKEGDCATILNLSQEEQIALEMIQR